MQIKKIIFILFVCFLLACSSTAQAGYIDNGDGTVTDNGTGLMWQQATAPDNYTWQAALAYCEDLDFVGYTDWRLPTAKELETLTDKSSVYPAINTTFFPDTPNTTQVFYWSSTKDAGRVGYAWRISFSYGTITYGNMTGSYYVRAVRSGQAGSFDNLTLWPVPDTGQTTCYDTTTEIECPQPGEAFYGQDASYNINTPAYTKLADNCVPLPDNATTWTMVRDAVTGLVWEVKHAEDSTDNYTNPNDADNKYTWYDGATGTQGSSTDTMDFINSLNAASYGGYTDWRMPTAKELQKIVDYGRTRPAINTTYFLPAKSLIYYWSSTSFKNDIFKAWGVGFDSGDLPPDEKSKSNYVRAVRSGACGSFGDLFIFKSGDGSGTVTSADGRIDCGIDCTEAYIQGAEVTLTAAAAADSIFMGWSGGGCSGMGSCVVTITDNVAVTANFSDGTVTDTGTGLMWQEVAPSAPYTWEDALAYCENLELAGYADWRMPTAKELASLVDTTRFNPASYFPDMPTLSYWSATAYAKYYGTAWVVSFNYGVLSGNGKSGSLYVRAVRAGQTGSFDNLTLWPVPDTGQIESYTETFGEDHDYTINQPAYTKLAAGCTPFPNNATTWAMVYDRVTGLVWEEKHSKGDGDNYTDPNDADNTYTWCDNNSETNGGNQGTCGDGTDTMDFIRAMNTANYGGFSDWRMPTVKELHSIVDYGLNIPAINPLYFPNTVASFYWSSGAFVEDSGWAWYVYLNDNDNVVDYFSKSNSSYARAVRSGQCGPFGDLVIYKSGTGAGTVSSADAKIDCGSACSAIYAQGTEVTLTAAAAAGSQFTGWGGGCSGTGQCVLAVTDNVTVAANFDLVPTTTTIPLTSTTTIIGGTTTTTIAVSTTTTTVSGRRCPAKKALGENNSNLENLRDFRDSKLAQSAIGRRIIAIYYNNADSINAALEHSPALRAAARRVLEAVAPLVGERIKTETEESRRPGYYIW